MADIPVCKFSFIIASVDRDHQLQRCISSIAKAHEYRKDIPVEILVVIQQASGRKHIQIRYPDITSFYYIDKKGLSVARNFAIRKSTGDYLIFLDDDAEIDEALIDSLSREVIVYNSIKAFCGKIIDPFQSIPFFTLFKRDRIKKLGWFDYQYFMGSAHVLSRKVIDKIGCYDERFGIGSEYPGAEESDIFFRLKAEKENILYLPNLVFYHSIPVVSLQYMYNYSYANGAMLVKNSFGDKKHFFVYFLIFSKTIVKSFINTGYSLIIGRIKKKHNRFYHTSILKGTLKGVVNFIFS